MHSRYPLSQYLSGEICRIVCFDCLWHGIGVQPQKEEVRYLQIRGSMVPYTKYIINMCVVQGDDVMQYVF